MRSGREFDSLWWIALSLSPLPLLASNFQRFDRLGEEEFQVKKRFFFPLSLTFSLGFYSGLIQGLRLLFGSFLFRIQKAGIAALEVELGVCLHAH